MCVHTTFELFDRDSRDVHHAPQQFGDLSFTHVVSAGSLDLRGRYGRPVRWPLADLERPGHRAERDRETVPAVDGHDRQREIDELSLAELLSSQLVHLVGDVFDADARDRFGPGERRTLALGEERRLAPQANGVQPLFRFAERSRDLGVHVGAIRAAVDERGPQLDQLEERSLESALVYILFETPHRGPDARGRLRVIDPWLHRCLLSFFGREDRAQSPAVPQILARRHSSCTIWLWSTNRFTSGPPASSTSPVRVRAAIIARSIPRMISRCQSPPSRAGRDR